jgi:ribosomal protein L11 methyltransferase
MTPTAFASLTCDQPTARRLASLVEAHIDGVVVAAFERDAGWMLEVYFAGAAEEATLRALVEDDAGAAAAAALTFASVEGRDWVAASLAGLKPVRAGRFIVHGAHHRGQLPGHAIGIEIEAALAFGTGHHGTTRGCLEALDLLLKSVCIDTVLDVGTGSGVLAIASAKAIRRRVFATDIDPVAVASAIGNARLNRAGALVVTRTADARRALPWRGPFDLIFANILLEPLTSMARGLTRRLAPGGHVVLSGLLPAQANAARSIYAAHGLALRRHFIIENWVTLLMQRGRK